MPGHANKRSRRSDFNLHTVQGSGNIGPMRSGIGGKIALLGISVIQGGYMLFDGTHYLFAGSYFGRGLGPWADLAAIVGIAPGSLAPAFIFLGALWLVGALALLANRRWSRPLLAVVSLVSLPYLILGTVLSLIALAILIFRGNALYAKPRRRA